MAEATESKPEPVGVIHGRFQVVHKDHIRYLEAGRALCDHLVVGITNPDPSLTGYDPANPDRSDRAANPLTYYERYRMIGAALSERGWPDESYSVVPFPVNRPELYPHYVPTDAIFFLTIYDRWGERKLEMFREAGLRTRVLWRKPPEEKGICATEVRALIASDGGWRDLVPASVAGLVERFGLEKRLRDITRKT